MEIERLDEADAVAVDREQADNQGVAPPETRDQQAYRAEYRATVEAAYTWDAAALELRQVWEAHETRWPSPEDADRDGDRSLNPEANAEVERGCGRSARSPRTSSHPQCAPSNPKTRTAT